MDQKNAMRNDIYVKRTSLQDLIVNFEKNDRLHFDKIIIIVFTCILLNVAPP